MSVIYLSHGFTIHPHRQVIERNGETIQVRPKTFSLLLALIDKPREILTKSYLLDKIWDDVTVEEQVLVQSIRELRQLFGNAEIIQTYPRKGYAWVADVESRAADSEAIQAPTPQTTNRKKYRLYAASFLAFMLLGAVLILFYLSLNKHSKNSTETDVVIILPIKNQIAGNDHNWVPLGGMDQLIRSLISNKNVQVMDTEYVLRLMEYAHLPRDYDTKNVSKIFEISGATLIIESQLSGSVETYQLEYKLRYKNDIKRGIVFDSDINQAIWKLAQVIVNQTGQKLESADNNAQNRFANELMARAQEKIGQGDYDAAQNLLNSLLQIDSHNLIAHEKFIDALLRLNRFEQAKQAITAALAIAKADGEANTTSIYFLLAILHWRQGATAEALSTLDNVQNLATLHNSILYQASSAEIRGLIEQQVGAFDKAQSAFEQAIKFDAVIRCPIGISANHIKLAKLFSMQNKVELALAHYDAAKSIIESHQFNDMVEELESAKPKQL